MDPNDEWHVSCEDSPDTEESFSCLFLFERPRHFCVRASCSSLPPDAAAMADPRCIRPRRAPSFPAPSPDRLVRPAPHAPVRRAHPAGRSPFVGLTVTVVGSNLSTVVGADGHFQISGVSGGPCGCNSPATASTRRSPLTTSAADQFIEIQIQVSGSSVEIVDELRTGKVSLCHAEGNGTYHQIDVSESSEPAHRDHGDAEIGEPVPGRPFMIFDANCRPRGRPSRSRRPPTAETVPRSWSKPDKLDATSSGTPAR